MQSLAFFLSDARYLFPDSRCRYAAEADGIASTA
jgi:hypothetical protein